MNLQPLADRVVVQPLEAVAKTKGGIVLPDTAKEKPYEGMIIAVGKGKVLDNGKTREPQVKIGDHVLYGKYSGAEVKILHEDKQLLIMHEDDILAVVK